MTPLKETGSFKGDQSFAHSTGAVVVLRPVAACKTGVGNNGARVGSVDKLSISGVNAHMGNTTGIGVRKKHDVTRLKIAPGHGSSHFVLIRRSTVGGVAKLLQYIVHKTGAIESAGAGTTVYIGAAKILLGFCQNLTAGCAGLCGRRTTGASGCAVQRFRAGSDSGGITQTEKLGAVIR